MFLHQQMQMALKINPLIIDVPIFWYNKSAVALPVGPDWNLLIWVETGQDEHVIMHITLMIVIFVHILTLSHTYTYIRACVCVAFSWYIQWSQLFCFGWWLMLTSPQPPSFHLVYSLRVLYEGSWSPVDSGVRQRFIGFTIVNPGRAQFGSSHPAGVAGGVYLVKVGLLLSLPSLAAGSFGENSASSARRCGSYQSLVLSSFSFLRHFFWMCVSTL